MKMKVVLDREAVIALINETVSKTVGQPMAVSTSYGISHEVELEPADVVAARKLKESVDVEVDVPRLTSELSQAAQEVEEEVSL